MGVSELTLKRLFVCPRPNGLIASVSFGLNNGKDIFKLIDATKTSASAYDESSKSVLSGLLPLPAALGRWREHLIRFFVDLESTSIEVVILYEDCTEFVRALRNEWAELPSISVLSSYWCEINEVLISAVAESAGRHRMVRIGDWILAGNESEPRLDNARVTAADILDEKLITKLQRLNEAFLLSEPDTLEEIKYQIDQNCSLLVRQNIERIQTIIQRHLQNSLAYRMSEDIELSRSIVQSFQIGHILSKESFGIVKSPALYMGRPILENRGSSWLAHAPEAAKPPATFCYPFLLLSGAYRIYLTILARESAARPAILTVSLDSNSDNKRLSWIERLEPGRDYYLSYRFDVAGDYNINIAIQLDATAINNDYTSVWIANGMLSKQYPIDPLI